jgi:phosphate/sulfate permease
VDISFLVLVVIITALAFDFTNGFHDTANGMATSIATGALRQKVAVAISGVPNLVDAFLSTEVAKTVSSGIVDDDKVTPGSRPAPRLCTSTPSSRRSSCRPSLPRSSAVWSGPSPR